MQKQRVPVMGLISAGKAIPNDFRDWEITGFRDIRLVDSPSDHLIAVPAEGDSLKELGILSGDYLVMKITADYEPDTLGVWQTPSGRTAKFAYYDFDGSVVLHNDNGWQERWDGNDLKLLGIVVRVERDL